MILLRRCRRHSVRRIKVTAVGDAKDLSLLGAFTCGPKTEYSAKILEQTGTSL